MKRSRLVAALVSILVIAGVSTWIFAAEEQGAPPPGTYLAERLPPWPVAGPQADAIREDALRRATIMLPGPRPSASSGRPEHAEGRGGPAIDAIDAPVISCRFLSDAVTGTSAKFDCVLPDGAVVKVKYGRNPEIHAEAAASRLLTALGYAADEVTVVPRLRCYGCPRFPYLSLQLLTLAGVPDLLAPHGYEDSYTDFEWVGVERKFPAPAIETGDTKGWAWFELKASHAPRAELDALRLLAVFLAHWDNKSENQRLVCLDDLPASPNHACARPLLMLQDLGATFGPHKVNLARWRDLPLWSDRRRCQVSMHDLPHGGATFPDAQISEEGRLLFMTQLAALTSADVEALFGEARFQDYQRATDDRHDLAEWTAAFRHRAAQVMNAGPCRQ